MKPSIASWMFLRMGITPFSYELTSYIPKVNMLTAEKIGRRFDWQP